MVDCFPKLASAATIDCGNANESNETTDLSTLSSSTERRFMMFKNREDCVYTECYCEENVWKLCEVIQDRCPDELSSFFAVFISNSQKAIPIWKQKASVKYANPSSPVVWDYHVILLHRHAETTEVYDLDTLLDFPVPLDTYLEEAIGSELRINPTYRRHFRVVAAEQYLSTFASDRSHMKKPDGSWTAKPPHYSCIATNNSTHNLPDFMNMVEDNQLGQLMNLEKLTLTFSNKSIYDSLPSLV